MCWHRPVGCSITIEVVPIPVEPKRSGLSGISGLQIGLSVPYPIDTFETVATAMAADDVNPDPVAARISFLAGAGGDMIKQAPADADKWVRPLMRDTVWATAVS